MVKDKAKWDFKHEVRRILRSDKFALSDGKELQWYEYSVPGNIHYGFVGRAAGFAAWELYAGAGYAEITDPAHVQRGEACCPEFCGYPLDTGPAYEVCIRLGCYYINPDWITSFFDDPQDKASVEFGVRMYNLYGKGLTKVQFQEYLADQGNTLTPAPPIYGPSIPNAKWPYDRGYFNGPDDEVNEPQVSMWLSK